MKKVIHLLVLLGLILTPSPPVTCQRSYDQFQLVQLWSPTFCKQPHNNCVSHLAPSFTLHGLWPANARGKTVTTCSTSLPDQNIQAETSALRTPLAQAWPSILAGKVDHRFWQHEWDTYGICCLSKMTAMNYFKSAIRERNRINLLSILQNANILPGDDKAYTKLDFEKAVTQFTGSGNKIYVSCRTRNSTHVALYEIYICLDDTATHYIPCPRLQSPKGCSGARVKNIVFPVLI